MVRVKRLCRSGEIIKETEYRNLSSDCHNKQGNRKNKGGVHDGGRQMDSHTDKYKSTKSHTSIQLTTLCNAGTGKQRQ